MDLSHFFFDVLCSNEQFFFLFLNVSVKATGLSFNHNSLPLIYIRNTFLGRVRQPVYFSLRADLILDRSRLIVPRTYSDDILGRTSSDLSCWSNVRGTSDITLYCKIAVGERKRMELLL